MGGGALSGDLSGTMRNMLGISQQFFDTVYKGVIGHHAFGMVPISMKPKSRGRISLESRNPFQWPKMEANYFDVEDDLRTLVEGAKMVLGLAFFSLWPLRFISATFPLPNQAVEMGESSSFRKYGARFHRTPFLGCEHLAFRSDEYWRCCIMRYTSSLQHQVRAFSFAIRAVRNKASQLTGRNMQNGTETRQGSGC